MGSGANLPFVAHAMPGKLTDQASRLLVTYCLFKTLSHLGGVERHGVPWSVSGTCQVLPRGVRNTPLEHMHHMPSCLFQEPSPDVASMDACTAENNVVFPFSQVSHFQPFQMMHLIAQQELI